VLAVTSTILLSPLSASPETGAAGNTSLGATPDAVRPTSLVSRSAPRLLSAPDEATRFGSVLRSKTSGDVARSVTLAGRGAEICRSARRAVPWYRGRQADWVHARRSNASVRVGRKPRSCPDARFLAQLAKRRSFAARQAYERWNERRTLRDFAFQDGARAWPRAVDEVQRVFPGTSGWLLSCSAAEGGHGRWVGYGGQRYSMWLRDSDTVGGPLQFRYSTFTGMFRRAADYVYAHDYRMPQFVDYTAAWRSALGQALAGGWARYTGNDDSHWSASWSRGC
jgi:hypothetical protein